MRSRRRRLARQRRKARRVREFWVTLMRLPEWAHKSQQRALLDKWIYYQIETDPVSFTLNQ